MTVADVPVDALWSITVDNADGYLESNDRRIGEALERLKAETWSIVAKALDEEQQGALRELIEQMCETYADQRYVSGNRASEFAQERQRSFVSVKGGGPVLMIPTP